MNEQLKIRSSVLFLAFVVLGVYYPTIFAPLNAIDDPGLYTWLLNADSFGLKEIFSQGNGGTYFRPLLAISYLADKHLWGLEESFMHLENIVFHLLNTLLLFAIARKACLLEGARTSLLPLLAAFFFAIHPINTESVNWISGRTDLLAGLFLLLSLLLLLRPVTSFPFSLLAALSMLVACLAKETAIFFLPAPLLLPFFLPGNGNGRETIRRTIRSNLTHFLIFVSAGAGYFAFRSFLSPRGDQGVQRVLNLAGGEDGLGMLTAIRLFLKAAGFYLKKLFVPFPLNFGIVHISDLYLPLGLLFLVIIIWLLTRRTLPAFFFICAAAVGSSGLLIPLLKLTWTPLAERYMYIPSAFFILGLTFTAWRYVPLLHPRLAASLVCILSVIAVWGTASRNILWQDNLALFQDTLQKSPGFLPAQNEIANALRERGRSREADALLMSVKFPETLNNYQQGLINQSSVLARRGDYEGAVELLNRIRKNPGRFEGEICKRLLQLYSYQVAEGKTTWAKVYLNSIELLTRLYELSGDPFYQYRLGLTHMGQHENRQALAALNIVVAQAPKSAYYRPAAEKLVRKLSH